MKKLSIINVLFKTKALKAVPLFVLLIFSVVTAHAQFFDALSNPTILVTLKHPPISGVKINKVAFGLPTGNCGDQITDALQSDFVANQVEVIDREHLNSMLAEHNFTLSGYVDQSTAVTMGKFLGPTTLVFVKVQICNTAKDRLYNNETVHDYKTNTNSTMLAYFARTRTNLKASIEAVDLTTGRIIVKQEFAYAPEITNKSYQGYPEYPSDFQVQQTAYNLMAGDVHQIFLPWTEKKQVIYYDNSKGGLKQAFDALKAGDLDQAFELSKQNVETCKSLPKPDEKLYEHALYNLGMSYMMRDDYNNALLNFREAGKIRPGDIVNTAIANCQKAMTLATAMTQIDQKAAFDASQKQAESDKATQKEVTNTLTNSDIIKLAQMKMSEAIILQKIKISKCNFDTSADALGLLTKSGVSEKIVMTMMEKNP